MKPYKCDLCGMGFTVVESLLFHQATRKKKLFIPVVQFHFLKDSLTMHEIIHSIVKP